MEGKPKSHHDLGLTDEEFQEVVDFFLELMRLDEKGKQLDKQRLRLTAVLHPRVAPPRSIPFLQAHPS